MRKLLTHIASLTGIVPEGVLRKQGAEMDTTGSLENAWLLVEDGRITAFGQMGCAMPEAADPIDTVIRLTAE